MTHDCVFTTQQHFNQLFHSSSFSTLMIIQCDAKKIENPHAGVSLVTVLMCDQYKHNDIVQQSNLQVLSDSI